MTPVIRAVRRPIVVHCSGWRRRVGQLNRHKPLDRAAAADLHLPAPAIDQAAVDPAPTRHLGHRRPLDQRLQDNLLFQRPRPAPPPHIAAQHLVALERHVTILVANTVAYRHQLRVSTSPTRQQDALHRALTEKEGRNRSVPQLAHGFRPEDDLALGGELACERRPGNELLNCLPVRHFGVAAERKRHGFVRRPVRHFHRREHKAG
jgi:hypothetical protein